MPIKEECCYKCKYCLEVYDPLPRSEKTWSYYCMLMFDDNSIIRIDNAFKSKCSDFERK